MGVPEANPPAATTTWHIPPWVFSRSYCLGTESARAILTNTRWWNNIVLEGTSAEIWHLLPHDFSLESIAAPLRSIGINTADADIRTEVLDFFALLQNEGLLCSETEAIPSPDHPADAKAGNGGVAATSVEADFFDWLTDRGKLPSAFLELTYRCNQRCVHCFNPGAARSPNEPPRRASDELTTEEVCRALGGLADLGVFTVTFSGGEPSLRPDLLEVLSRAKSLGFSYNIYTNGQVSAAWLHAICSLWPRTVGVSLYSAIPDIHDATTGGKGSFERAVGAVRLISAAGIRAIVKCPLMGHTIHGYKRLLDLCEELNALPQFDLQLTAGMDGDARCTVHQIHNEHLLKLVMADPRFPMHIGPATPSLGRYRRPMDGPVCGAGRYSISIAPDGTVFPCNGLPLAVGNVRTTDIRQLWERSRGLAAWRSVTLADFNECGLYLHCAYCQHCPGMAMAETGDLLAVSRACCTVAHARMELSREVYRGDTTTAEQAEYFGRDMSLRHPAEPKVAAHVGSSCDPRSLSSEDFTKRIAEIHRTGNPCRQHRFIEDGSPAVENLRETSEERGSRLRELGR